MYKLASAQCELCGSFFFVRSSKKEGRGDAGLKGMKKAEAIK